MTSELDKIEKGLVQATVEFDTQRKVIGVSTSNLLPNENGIVPLSKQNAFQPVETVDFSQAVNEVQTQPNEAVIEQLDLPVLSDEPIQSQGLKEPVHNDVIVDSPVNIENPMDLTGFKIPEPVMEESPAAMEPVGPTVLDIQMPQMPQTVVANEPDGLDENIFEDAAKQTLVNPLEATAPLTQSEDILNSIPSTTPVNDQPPMFEPVQETEQTQTNNVNIEMPVASTPQMSVPEVTPTIEPMPAVEANVQSVAESMPTVEETLPVVDTPQMNVPEVTPAIEPTPTVEPNIQPVAESMPAVEETLPVVDTPQMSVPEVTPAIEPMPTVEANIQPVAESVPAVEETLPVVDTPQMSAPTDTEPVSEPPVLNPVEQPADLNEKVPEVLNIDEIIANHKKVLLEYAEALIASAQQIKDYVNKSFDDIEKNIKNAQVSEVQEEQKQDIQPILSQASNMINTGNNLVEDAISRINAIPVENGPRL